MPRTRLGRWGVASFGVGLVGLALMTLSVSSGQRGGDTLVDNWWISGPALLAAAGFVAAFPVGSIAIFGRGERSLTVFVTTALAALVTLFLVMEVSFPH